MSDSESVVCGDCGASLAGEDASNGDASGTCRACGSDRQLVRLIFNDVVTRPRDWIQGKVRDGSRRSKEKIRKEFFYGSQERKSVGDFIYKEREIDRDADRYRELVREEDGKVIREVDHPLSSHTGHGSDKFKPVKGGTDGGDLS